MTIQSWACRPIRNRSARRGLVIREIVVLTIVPTLLMYLLLPAVYRVREAARRMQCTNNLKQHMLAVHNFADTYTRLPPGCSENLDGLPEFGESDGRNLYAWGAFILPYLEAGDTYGAMKSSATGDLEGCFYDEAAGRAVQQPLTVFRCPSDTSAPKLNYGRTFEVNSETTAPLALSNYVAVNGSRDLAMIGGSDGASGMFYWNSKLDFSSILDGMSNTIAIGERAWIRERGSRYRGRAAVAYGVRSTQESSFYGLADAMGSGRFRINFTAVDQPSGLGESYVRRGFSSNHPGGASFAMADGGVRFLRNDIDADMDPETQCTRTPEVDSSFEALLSINDGIAVPDDY